MEFNVEIDLNVSQNVAWWYRCFADRSTWYVLFWRNEL